jgi:photosystem II stability/assembly factor-like uncharacterized protein
MKKYIFSTFIIICIFASPLFAQWIERWGGTTEDLNDVVMTDSTTAIVVGSNGSILKTSDSGETWNNIAPPVDCLPGTDCILKWNAISFYDALNGIVVGDEVMKTTDGGKEWEFLYIPGGSAFISVFYTITGAIYVGDDSGFVHFSSDSGKTWLSEKITDLPIRSVFPFKAELDHLVLYEPKYFALTPHTLFIKTEYPSVPWNEWGSLGYFNEPESEAFKGGFAEDGTAFIAGGKGLGSTPSPEIIRLRPFDSHWYSVGPENGEGELRGISIPSSAVIYTCGANGTLLKSSNGGDYWIYQNTPTTQILNSVYFFDNERGFAVGNSGTILCTYNGGVSPSNNPPAEFHLFAPVHEHTTSIPRSINFTWQRAFDPDYDPVRYTLLISSDTCRTWKFYGPVHDTTLSVQSPAMFPGRYFWTVIATDDMLATPSRDVFALNIYSVSKVDEPENNTPVRFELFQNYPNPFNPVTTIHYSIPYDETVILKVYDMLGREIATLVQEKKPVGRYGVEFDGSSLCSGVYIYNLRAGTYTDTKRFVLLR